MKVFSIMLCWMVLTVTFWKLSWSETLNNSRSFSVPSIDFYLYGKVVIKMTTAVLSYASFPIKKKKCFWVPKNMLTQILVTSNHMFFQRTFVWNSQIWIIAYGRLWLEIKQSDKQLLLRRLILTDCLPKFNTEKYVWSNFVLSGTNGLTRVSFFLISSQDYFTEVANYFKFYWNYCRLSIWLHSFSRNKFKKEIKRKLFDILTLENSDIDTWQIIQKVKLFWKF